MRKLLAGLVLAAAMVACRGEPVAPVYAAAPPPEVPSATITESTEIIAVASARRSVPGLYWARGVTNAQAVHLVVRRNSAALGFQSLTSGVLIAEDTFEGPLDIPFTSSSGYRYLIVAYPQTDGVDDTDRASFVEIVT